MKHVGKGNLMIRPLALLLSVVMCGGMIGSNSLQVQAEEWYEEQYLGGELVMPEPEGEDPLVRASGEITYSDNGAAISRNVGSHDYLAYFAMPTYSYLFEDENGNLVRVENIGDTVIETYSPEFELLDSKEIDRELNAFGGFFAGADAYYIVYGGWNPDESDDAEVLRVVKYSKDWKRLDSASLFGANTYLPFDASPLHMTEYNGVLYIRTGHRQYQDKWGDNHQSNWTIVVNESDMQILESYDVSFNLAHGSVGHCFCEFIKEVDGKIVTVDLGDANPRAVVLGSYDIKGDGALGTFSYTIPYKIPGIPGRDYNYTGVYLGDFEVSDTHYLIAASKGITENSVVLYTNPLDNFEYAEYSPLEAYQPDEVKTIQLLDPQESKDIIVPPYLVEVDKDTYVVIWEIYVAGKLDARTIQMVAVDGTGEKISDIKTFTGSLSDCQPIYKDGQIIWYATGNKTGTISGFGTGGVGLGGEESAPVFYTFNVEKKDGKVSITQDQITLLGITLSETSREFWVGETAQLTAVFKPEFAAPFSALNWSSSDPSVATVEDGVVTALRAGTCVITAQSGSAAAQCTIVCSQTIRSFVARMYEVALNRRYEDAGLEDWTGQLLRHENDGAGIAQGFIMSKEFTNRNLGDEDYVDTLYHTFFNREPDAGGRSGWLESLALGNTRTFVLAGFVNSTEFENLCAEYGVDRGILDTAGEGRITTNIRDFVLRIYTKAMGRDGERAGVVYWSQRIAGGIMTPEEVAKSFFFSEEFANKGLSNEDYVETLYQTFMDRASDADGRAYWLDRLANGATTEEVLEGFSRSEEFGKIVADFGL